MENAHGPFGLYLYNGRIRPVAHDMDRWIPHLLVMNGRVVHDSAGTAPLGLDFRQADFGRVRQEHSPSIAFVDLRGAVVLPGLCDAHVHFLWWSDSREEVDLSGCHGLEEALEKIRLAVQALPHSPSHRVWLRGHGWSHNSWPGGRLPTAGQLDSVTGHIPTLLTSKCGHLAWVNSTALDIAGIRTAVCPEGGEIVQDADGEPTGILAENAIQLVMAHIPARTRDRQKEAFLCGQAEAHSLGITAMHTPESIDHFSRYQDYRNSGDLAVRINFLMPVANLPAMEDMALTKGLGDDMLRISGTKLFADGSLGGRTAALYEPYEKEPTNTGIVVSTDEEILLATRASQKLGIPMVIHAIGDRAVGSVLRAYHECHLEREADGWERLPHRIEHLQLLHPQDADLLATVRPVASVQPVHLCADIDAILEHWGSRRLHGAYAFRTIREAGCPLIFGSDAPVEPISPWLGLYGAVTRSDLEGRHPDGVVRSERLTVPECLEAYTAGPARAVGQWPRVGSLLVGAYADFAIYGEDPSMESPESWKSTRALATFVGGKCVWTEAGQEYYWEVSQGTRK